MNWSKIVFVIWKHDLVLSCLSIQEHRDLHLYVEMFILSMKWRFSLDMSDSFDSLVVYFEWDFMVMFFSFVFHSFKTYCARFLRFWLFSPALFEQTSGIQWNGFGYLLLFSIRWCSLGKVTVAELPEGTGIGHSTCRQMRTFKGEQLWGTTSRRNFASRGANVPLWDCTGEQYPVMNRF